MSSIQPVQNAAVAAASAARVQSAPKPTAGQDSPAQEAQETLAATRTQAAQGDPQAIRKLARIEAANAAPPAAAPARGVNLLA